MSSTKKKADHCCPEFSWREAAVVGAVAGVATAVVVAGGAEAVEVVAREAAAEAAESVSALEDAAVVGVPDVAWVGGAFTA